jgi:formate C-acetyltransferase/benzylsuccinate synthase
MKINTEKYGSEELIKPMTERARKLKDSLWWKHTRGGEYVEKGVKAGIERARYMTQSFKETDGEEWVIRRAKALANVLDNMTIFIKDHELLVGDHAEKPNLMPIYQESNYFLNVDLLRSPYCPDEKEEFREIAEWWKPHTIQAKAEEYIDKDEKALQNNNASMESPGYVTGYSSPTPAYESVFEDGLEGRIKRIEGKLKEAQDEFLHQNPWNGPEAMTLPKKMDEWKAMLIADKAVIRWAKRYARLARYMAEEEKDPKRKEELLMIADICEHVPAKPCRGFRDAVQVQWFTYLIVQSLERYGSGMSCKMDTMWWPYYKRSVIDKSEQPMTREEAVELVVLHRLKVSEHGVIKSRLYREIHAGANDLFIITIGGVNPDGSNACNDLTNVILEAAATAMTTEPSLGLRWHKNMPELTARYAFECIKRGLGFPSIKNDDTAIPSLVEGFGSGKLSIQDARRWALCLCMSPGPTGRHGGLRTRWACSSYTAKCLELALSDGYDYSYTDSQLGPHTGDPTKFKTFDDLLQAYKIQYQHVHSAITRARDLSRYLEAKFYQSPFISSLDDGCVERGIDGIEWDEFCNPWFNVMDDVVVADSLTAVKKLVFEDKKYTMQQLVEALRANWDGYEEMRLDFWNAPKWGNDDDYADEIGKNVFRYHSLELQQNTNLFGAHPKPLPQHVAIYWTLGPRIGATSNGRRHGEVLDDGGNSPYIGCDKKGPTAVLNSCSKIDYSLQKGCLLNQKLDHNVMRSDKGFPLWFAYMKTWHKLGIDHVQFNVCDAEELREAQKQPEKYPDLIVRVAGYSARFVDLSVYAQDTIIARTEQELAG